MIVVSYYIHSFLMSVFRKIWILSKVLSKGNRLIPGTCGTKDNELFSKLKSGRTSLENFASDFWRKNMEEVRFPPTIRFPSLGRGRGPTPKKPFPNQHVSKLDLRRWNLEIRNRRTLPLDPRYAAPPALIPRASAMFSKADLIRPSRDSCAAPALRTKTCFML